jgi:gametolysin peptidase M11
VLRVRWVAPVGTLLALFFATPAEPVTGQQRVLLVLATWGPEPYGPAQIQSVVREAERFVQTSSFGRLTLRIDVTRWADVLVRPARCSVDWWDGGVPRAVTGPGKQAAELAGFRLSAYERVVYVIPASPCVSGGVADGHEAMLDGAFSTPLLLHELGHTWQLAHSKATLCLVLCGRDEYGDFYSVMGEGMDDFTVFEKLEMGWGPRVRVVRGSGTFTLGRADRTGTLPVALRIPHGQLDYWFEYRPAPRVINPDYQRLPGGVLVRFVDKLDVVAGQGPPEILLLEPSGRNRPAMLPGERFKVDGAFTVRVVRQAAGTAVLRVIRAAPQR